MLAVRERELPQLMSAITARVAPDHVAAKEVAILGEAVSVAEEAVACKLADTGTPKDTSEAYFDFCLCFELATRWRKCADIVKIECFCLKANTD